MKEMGGKGTKEKSGTPVAEGSSKPQSKTAATEPTVERLTDTVSRVVPVAIEYTAKEEKLAELLAVNVGELSGRPNSFIWNGLSDAEKIPFRTVAKRIIKAL